MDDPHEVAEVAACLEALGNPTRLQVYRLLVRAGPQGLPVGRVQEALGAAASTLTHHISRLLRVGLIQQRRQGRQLICSADFEGLDQMLGFLVRECCQEGSAWSQTRETLGFGVSGCGRSARRVKLASELPTLPTDPRVIKWFYLPFH